MSQPKIAFLFPGQGSQSVGMGKNIYETCPTLRGFFDELCSAVDFDLKKICFEGPEDQLNQTDHSQPAIFAVSMLALRMIEEHLGVIPVQCTAGLSLGEYSALAFARVLDVASAMKLVAVRGKLMHQTGKNAPGTMASIIGLDAQKVEEICQLASKEHYVCVANLNCPGQVVISGSIPGVQLCGDKARALGARQVIGLSVSGAFHSKLMKNAAEEFALNLNQTQFQAQAIPLISNVTADVVGANGHLSQLLARQLCEPVLWEKSMRRMIDQGIDLFVEIGSGKVLKGLMRRIDRNQTVISIEQFDDLQTLRDSLE